MWKTGITEERNVLFDINMRAFEQVPNGSVHEDLTSDGSRLESKELNIKGKLCLRFLFFIHVIKFLVFASGQDS